MEQCKICGTVNETVDEDRHAWLDADYDMICLLCYGWSCDTAQELYYERDKSAR